MTSKHFSEAELRCKGSDCCGGENACTAGLVAALEALRADIGKPVIIVSGYRCREHNRRAGGAPRSQHVTGKAADIRVQGMTAAELEAAAKRVPGINGIGRNDRAQTLHVDVRNNPAHWCYDERGRWCAYYPPIQG